MITYVVGDLFKSPARVLVNTVNTVGVMGKGIAKDFKKVYPDMFKQYQVICENKQLDIGKLWLYKTNHKWIMNFPTKKHWRSPSRPEYIEAGLRKFVSTYAEKGIASISFPMLGCGNGELNWENEVRPLMEKYLDSLPIDIFVHIYRHDLKTVEHRNIEAIKRWLRSEPGSLSFEEVWDDLLSTLHYQKDYKTLEYGEDFSAQVFDNADEGIIFSKGGVSYQVPKEDLLAIWQHVRDVGFCLKEIIPGSQYQVASLIMALFNELPYLEPVLITNDYQQLNDKSIGLRLWPRDRFTQNIECINGEKQYELAFES